MSAKVRKKTKSAQPKTVLVPIDFSASSAHALKHALGLAGDASRILLLHVVASMAKDDADLAKSIENATRRLEQFCKSDGILAPALIKLNVRCGTPFREILECAKENDAAMIVLGLNESSPLRGIELGHTADRVSRYALCPVLLVRERGVDVASS